MSKETSQILKGIAILFMIFFHLFSQMKFVDLCAPLLYIGDSPLVYLFSNSTNPVALFLIISGYGLYKTSEKGKDYNRWGRILKLLIHFWIILIVFVSVGHFIKPEVYPGSLLKVFLNFSTFDTSYNGELWFLFPYICVSIFSPTYFKSTKNISWYWIVLGTLFIYISCIFLMTRVIGFAPRIENSLYTLLCIPLFFFNFSLGMLAAREKWYEKIKENVERNNLKVYFGILTWILAALLFTLNIVFKYNFFYQFLFLSCMVFAPMPRFVKDCLVKLGNQSMNMWMIHSWFCYHLFSDFIYSFKYPLIIFIVLVIISYYLSFFFNFLSMPIERILLTKKEIKEKPIL